MDPDGKIKGIKALIVSAEGAKRLVRNPDGSWPALPGAAPVDLAPYVTETELSAALNALPEPEPVDLTAYALKSELHDAPDQLRDAAAYLREMAPPAPQRTGRCSMGMDRPLTVRLESR